MPLSGWNVFSIKVADGSRLGLAAVPCPSVVPSVSVALDLDCFSFGGSEYFVVIRVV